MTAGSTARSRWSPRRIATFGTRSCSSASSPSALGRQVQNTTHDILGIDCAYGWGKQLRDEPG